MKIHSFLFLLTLLTCTLFSHGAIADGTEDNPVQLNTAAINVLWVRAHHIEAFLPEFCDELETSLDYENPSVQCEETMDGCTDSLRNMGRTRIQQALEVCEPMFNDGDNGCVGMGLGANFRLSDECFDHKTPYTECVSNINLNRILVVEKAKFQIIVRTACIQEEETEDPVDTPEEPEDPADPEGDLPINPFPNPVKRVATIVKTTWMETWPTSLEVNPSPTSKPTTPDRSSGWNLHRRAETKGSSRISAPWDISKTNDFRRPVSGARLAVAWREVRSADSSPAQQERGEQTE